MRRIVISLTLGAGVALLVLILRNPPGKASPMPKPVLQDSYDPIDEATLAAVEARLDVRFPDDYRQFLLRTNGGEFPFTVSTTDDLADPKGADLDYFHCVAKGQSSDIEEEFSLVKDRMPPGHAPIAGNGSGDMILIMATGPDAGAICTWDHERDETVGIRVVARSFREFYDSLQYDEIVQGSWRQTVPEFAAVERGDLGAICQSLDAGFDIESQNGDGATLLGVAASNRQAHIVRELLSRGADVAARDKSQQTPLHLASWGHSLDGARLLLDAGADINAVDDHGDTPLIITAGYSDRLAKELIRRGANVNCKNKTGQTPLNSSVNWGDDELRETLLRHGARE